MNKMSLFQYLQLKSQTVKRFDCTSDKLYLKGCCSFPDVATMVIRLFNIKATVLYYCLVSLDNGKTQFIYRFTILYPDNHYEQGNYLYDYETPFNDYITQYVQCQILNLYTPCIPVLKEAVIFNHI